jgi:hypothetical protein
MGFSIAKETITREVKEDVKFDVYTCDRCDIVAREKCDHRGARASEGWTVFVTEKAGIGAVDHRLLCPNCTALFNGFLAEGAK